MDKQIWIQWKMEVIILQCKIAKLNGLLICQVYLLGIQDIIFNYSQPMVQRVTYRRRLSYNTASNKVRKVRTPGSRVVVHYVQKKATGVRAPHDSCDCGKRVNGIPKLSSAQYHRISRRQKTVSRAYGGVLCPGCVKQRIIRAFLLEEMKVVKRLANAEKKDRKDKRR